MSSTATDYSAGKLYGGITAAILVEILSFSISSPVLLKQGNIRLWSLLMNLSYGLMTFASSFVEEEHQYWYFLASAWFLRLGMKQYVRSFSAKALMIDHCNSQRRNNPWSVVWALIPLATIRVIRAWNHTGQKHAAQPDIARGLSPSHHYMLWAVTCIIYLALPRKMQYKSLSQSVRRISFVYATVLCGLGYAFKIAFTLADAPELLNGLPITKNGILAWVDLVMQARALFLGMLLLCAGVSCSGQWRSTHTTSGRYRAIQGEKSLHARDRDFIARVLPLHGVLTLFLMTQSRITNIPLFALFELQLQSFASMDLSSNEISLTSIILQYVSFFAFGGTNAISSIDLSNGYNGVRGYNAAVVGALTFCSNWAGPIWWTSATMLLLARQGGQRSGHYRYHHLVSTCFVANNVLFVMLACTALRTHLFIWTVFSPKYLYVMAWSLGLHLLVNTSIIGLFTLLENS